MNIKIDQKELKGKRPEMKGFYIFQNNNGYIIIQKVKYQSSDIDFNKLERVRNKFGTKPYFEFWPRENHYEQWLYTIKENKEDKAFLLFCIEDTGFPVCLCDRHNKNMIHICEAISNQGWKNCKMVFL